MANRSDLDPPSLKSPPGREARHRDEARVVLIPSGSAGAVLHEPAEYRSATCSRHTDPLPRSPAVYPAALTTRAAG